VTGRGRLGDGLDGVDRAALVAFDDLTGPRSFAPVLVLIAAYQEEATIGAVLDALPTQVGEGDLAVDRLVVVDGGRDATARVAAEHGAFVCACATNRGQGAALRLGYRIARDRGARYVATTDADGQYVADELGRLVEPLQRGDADFVTGSRWLGSQQQASLTRRVGSRVFAWVATRLSGQRITDTSFGFRAMTADVTAHVTLRQPQYQSAELLLEVLGAGYRVLEVPMTMRARQHGRSKKGSNLRFGAAYTRAVLATGWRLRQARRRPPRPRPEPRSVVAVGAREDHPVE